MREPEAEKETIVTAERCRRASSGEHAASDREWVACGDGENRTVQRHSRVALCGGTVRVRAE